MTFCNATFEASQYPSFLTSFQESSEPVQPSNLKGPFVTMESAVDPYPSPFSVATFSDCGKKREPVNNFGKYGAGFSRVISSVLSSIALTPSSSTPNSPVRIFLAFLNTSAD